LRRETGDWRDWTRKTGRGKTKVRSNLEAQQTGRQSDSRSEEGVLAGLAQGAAEQMLCGAGRRFLTGAKTYSCSISVMHDPLCTTG
jgi:hypothetical protein